MEKHTVTIEARHLGLISKAFSMIQGRKPLTLSYKIGRILEPIHALQQDFINQIAPFIGEGGNLREDLTDEERAAVEALTMEEVAFEIPTVTLGEIMLNEGLTVADDSVLPYLVDIGVLSA